jgi:hypothetical protein
VTTVNITRSSSSVHFEWSSRSRCRRHADPFRIPSLHTEVYIVYVTQPFTHWRRRKRAESITNRRLIVCRYSRTEPTTEPGTHNVTRTRQQSSHSSIIKDTSLHYVVDTKHPPSTDRLSVAQVISEHIRRSSWSGTTTSGWIIQDIVLHTCALGVTYAYKGYHRIDRI